MYCSVLFYLYPLFVWVAILFLLCRLGTIISISRSPQRYDMSIHCTFITNHTSFNTQCQNRDTHDFSFVHAHLQLIVVFFESLTQLPHNINDATPPLYQIVVRCPVIEQWWQSKTPQIIINSSLTPWFETI